MLSVTARARLRSADSQLRSLLCWTVETEQAELHSDKVSGVGKSWRTDAPMSRIEAERGHMGLLGAQNDYSYYFRLLAL